MTFWKFQIEVDLPFAFARLCIWVSTSSKPECSGISGMVSLCVKSRAFLECRDASLVVDPDIPASEGLALEGVSTSNMVDKFS